MMLVLLLVGCLTPESFGRQYGVRFCEELEACNGEPPDEANCVFDNLEEDCPDFDPQAAADCLATESEEWCVDDSFLPDACRSSAWCPE